MTEACAIRTHGLSKCFGSLKAVDALDLEIPQGVVAGFLGPNGAGKTTTLRMLTGLATPSDGSFELAKNCKPLGALVEAPSFPSYMSGLDNLIHLARLKGVGSPQDEAEDLLGRVGLASEAWIRPVGEYSTGMRGRLGVAFALLGKPKLIILDEPTRGLDPTGRHLVLDVLGSYAADEGATIFVSSHLLWEVEALADWVVVLHEGKGIFQGSIDDLRKPKGEGGIFLKSEGGEIVETFCQKRAWSCHVEDEGHRIQLPSDDVPFLVEGLVKLGVAIHTVEPRKDTLEDLYLALTGNDAL